MLHMGRCAPASRARDPDSGNPCLKREHALHCLCAVVRPTVQKPAARLGLTASRSFQSTDNRTAPTAATAAPACVMPALRHAQQALRQPAIQTPRPALPAGNRRIQTRKFLRNPRLRHRYEGDGCTTAGRRTRNSGPAADRLEPTGKGMRRQQCRVPGRDTWTTLAPQ